MAAAGQKKCHTTAVAGQLEMTGSVMKGCCGVVEYLDIWSVLPLTALYQSQSPLSPLL